MAPKDTPFGITCQVFIPHAGDEAALWVSGRTACGFSPSLANDLQVVVPVEMSLWTRGRLREPSVKALRSGLVEAFEQMPVGVQGDLYGGVP
jgi:hypothetical protein